MATSTVVSPKGMTRREFLHYLWGVSLTFVAAESCGAIMWFALPRERLGVDFFQFESYQIPAVGSDPLLSRKGKFLLSNTEAGLFAFSRACPHEGCYVIWYAPENRFICPCCAGYFGTDGVFLYNGPACRDLSRFIIQVKTTSGAIMTPLDGGPVNIQGATEIIVNIHQKIVRPRRTQPSYCSQHS